VLAPDLFREATILYALSLIADDSDKSSNEARTELQASWELNEAQKASEKVGLDKWSREETKRILALDQPPSSLGIAREYARLLAEAKPEDLPTNPKKSLALAEQICTLLDLPSRFVQSEEIFQATEAES
jgi:hypothetical protein